MGEALFERAGVERVAEQKLGGGDRGPGIVDLMGALQARQRQVQQSRRRAEDEPAVLLVHIEVAAGDMERRANLIGARLDHAKRFGLLPADHARDARLEDAGLFARDLRKRVAEKGDMVDRDRGDRGKRGLRHDIGGVEPSAQSGLEQQIVGGVSAKARKAAAVVISNSVISSPPLAASARARQSTSTSSAIGAEPCGPASTTRS